MGAHRWSQGQFQGKGWCPCWALPSVVWMTCPDLSLPNTRSGTFGNWEINARPLLILEGALEAEKWGGIVGNRASCTKTWQLGEAWWWWWWWWGPRMWLGNQMSP